MYNKILRLSAIDLLDGMNAGLTGVLTESKELLMSKN
jgi:hypothetical protein